MAHAFYSFTSQGLKTTASSLAERMASIAAFSAVVFLAAIVILL